MLKWSPHVYQRSAIEWVKANPRSGLFLDMGLGKTSITLSAVRDMLAAGIVRRVLVIAPKRVADRTWSDEAAKWSHLAGLKIVRILGTAAGRLAALNTSGHVWTINRENVAWLAEQFPKGLPFDMVVIDESSSFKSPSAIRFKSLRRVIATVPRVLLLTGTPVPNSYLELWPQVFLLDRGERLGRSMTAYKAAYFDSDYMGWKHKLRPGAREQIEQRLGDVVLSLRAGDWLDVPARVNRVIPEWHLLKLCRMAIFSDSLLSDYAGLSE